MWSFLELGGDLFASSWRRRLGHRKAKDIGHPLCGGIDEVQVVDGEPRPYGHSPVLEAALKLGKGAVRTGVDTAAGSDDRVGDDAQTAAQRG